MASQRSLAPKTTQKESYMLY